MKPISPPLGIVNFPHWLFTSMEHLAFQSKLEGIVFSAAVRDQPLLPEVLEKLKWYPRTAARLIADGYISKEDRENLSEDPLFGYQMLSSNYGGEWVSWMENKLFNSPAATEMILLYRRSAADGPTSADDAYLECMSSDPNRVIRSVRNDENGRERIAQIEKDAPVRRVESAPWTYCFLDRCAGEASVDLIDSLRNDEEYAYLAARLLADRRSERALWGSLIDSIHTPRWAFHVLRDGLADEQQRARLMEVLLSCPPWLIELLATANMPRSTVAGYVAKSSLCYPSHPCREEALAWVKSRAPEGLTHSGSQ